MRGRWIRPETWISPTLSAISRDAVLLFVALWNYADDEGRGLADPVLIRSTLFPLRKDVSEADVAEWLGELRRARLVVLYRAAPRPQSDARSVRKAADLLQIRSWEEHQKVQRPSESRYPAPKKRRGGSVKPRGRLLERSASSSKEVQETEVVQDGPRLFPLDEIPSTNGSTSPASPVEPPVSWAERYRDRPNPFENLTPVDEDPDR